MDKKEFKAEVIDFIKDLVIIVLIVLFIRTFLVEPFQISGQSMSDSYYDKEFIIVDRFSYLDILDIKKWKIKRWDVIVFKPWVDKYKEYFIKRVIWIPWDKVKIVDWKVSLKKSWDEDFIELDENSYLSDENNWKTYVRGVKKGVIKIYDVPNKSYFVMWDNRNWSSDSRSCFASSCSFSTKTNFIKKDVITGKIFVDLGYFNFKDFSFVHPWSKNYSWLEWIITKPRFFNSPSTHNYE